MPVLDPACTLPEIEVVLLLDGVQMPAQLGAGDDLMPPEINVLHAEAGAFEEAQAGAIHEDGHEARSAVELTDDRPHLIAGEHDG